jgi:hypothetical protein
MLSSGSLLSGVRPPNSFRYVLHAMNDPQNLTSI